MNRASVESCGRMIEHIGPPSSPYGLHRYQVNAWCGAFPYGAIMLPDEELDYGLLTQSEWMFVAGFLDQKIRDMADRISLHGPTPTIEGLDQFIKMQGQRDALMVVRSMMNDMERG